MGMSFCSEFPFLDDNFFAMKMFAFQVLISEAAKVSRKEDKNRKGNETKTGISIILGEQRL